MDSIAHRAALVAISVVLATMAAPATSSAQFVNSYCGVLLNPGSWCGDGSNHSYDFNRATYPGSGNVWVCQRLLVADTTTQREAPTCAYNIVSKTFPAYQWLTEAEVSHNTSGSSAQHTIDGYATA